MYKIDLSLKDYWVLFSQTELAKRLGHTQPRLSQLINSDKAARIEMKLKTAKDMRTLNEVIELCQKLDVIQNKARAVADRADITLVTEPSTIRRVKR